MRSTRGRTARLLRVVLPEAGGIGVAEWIVADVAVEIGVAGSEPRRIFAEPTADDGIIVPAAVVLQPGLGIKLPAGVVSSLA